MNRLYVEDKLLRLAKEAFDIACTLRSNQRVEVYFENELPKRSDILEENNSLIYGPNRILCYQIYGHDYLEPEITAWITSARKEEHPKELEESIIQTAQTLATSKGIPLEEVHSNEVFANLNMNQLEQIEHAILEYWWHNNEEENARALAVAQIKEALDSLKV